MKVAIIGYSTLAQSESIDAYNYYKDQGATITIYYWEGNTSPQDLPSDVTAIKCAGDQVFNDLDGFDLVVRGPGVHPKLISTSSRITTAVNEFMEVCPAPIIGVTGTKGKGTTSTLITKMLQAAGHTVHLGGNIGVPPLSLLPKINASDIVVLELSSFQLIDITHSPQTGVCLMVVPEHLNWHADMEEYLQAKSRMFKYQTDSDRAVFNAQNDNSKKIVSISPGSKVGYAIKPNDMVGVKSYVKDSSVYYESTKICEVSDIALLGKHNQENVCAAIAAVWPLIDNQVEALVSVIKSFTGLEHRLEKVRELHGVSYYDDSFATTPETAIAALQSFSQPVVLIAGGAPKGIPFDSLANEITKRNVKRVLAIGTAGPEIAKLLETRGYTDVTTEQLDTMPKIVEAAAQVAQPGDVVLLSTACASFDMFKDYKDRGDQFKQAVRSLA